MGGQALLPAAGRGSPGPRKNTAGSSARAPTGWDGPFGEGKADFSFSYPLGILLLDKNLVSRYGRDQTGNPPRILPCS